jgi:methionine aminopeptidase
MQLKYKKAGEIFEGNKFIKYLRMNTQLKLTNITNINNKTIKNNNYIDNKNDKKKIKKNNNSSLNITNFENKFDILKKKKKKSFDNG